MPDILRVALPKGRITEAVVKLLSSAGFELHSNGGRSYRPQVSDPEIEVKFLKPQNIPKLLEIGAHDCGFSGHDWVMESGADVVELLDTGLDPVRLVSAAPEGTASRLRQIGRPILVASEFENVTRRYMEKRGQPFVFIRTHGATEVFPPEDADLIVDLVQTGSTLRANRLEVLDVILESSTRFLVSRATLADPWKAAKIESIQLLLQGVLAARPRVILEVNVVADKLQAVVDILPALKSPTIQELAGGRGYAVKGAVLRRELAALVVKLRAAGATDLITYPLEKVIP